MSTHKAPSAGLNVTKSRNGGVIKKLVQQKGVVSYFAHSMQLYSKRTKNSSIAVFNARVSSKAAVSYFESPFSNAK